MRLPLNTTPNITTQFNIEDPNALFGRHSGIDFALPMYSGVFSPNDGIVIFAQFHPVRGHMVCIYDGTFTHRLLHNSDQYKVSVGQQVSIGQLVILSGNSGLSTGPHLHWDVVRGRTINPASFNNFIDPLSLLKGGKGADNTMSITDKGLVRIMAFHIAGRNGQDGRPNALDGSLDNVDLQGHVGQETNAELWSWYNSPEGRQFREQVLPAVYAERETLRQQHAILAAQVAELSTRPTQANFNKLQQVTAECSAAVQTAQAETKAQADKLAALQGQQAENEKQAVGFLQVLANLLKRIKQ